MHYIVYKNTVGINHLSFDANKKLQSDKIIKTEPINYC